MKRVAAACQGQRDGDTVSILGAESSAGSRALPGARASPHSADPTGWASRPVFSLDNIAMIPSNYVREQFAGFFRGDAATDLQIRARANDFRSRDAEQASGWLDE
jgi:hypothetical protein